ncbi:SDR family oxidoreductase [Pseudonocardia sp. DSM 110487]|uniref:SDR family oxidoreductase n=1 Tax=Pseudonocardia sp. DSM 110487 TaxID=2865833 RepID=UPI001C69B6D3|nr:SDR family oxidoreductase [Pseudonocardia sp. DSM 110487]QYN36038.1 SDR family oxidoreductase [Pseudonocardia sp. DSM 110487]
MDTGLKGRTAVVPGASSGLGLAVARALAAEGANVVLGGRRGELVREEASKLPAAVGIEVDLTDPAATDALVGAAQDHFGPVDVLVLNGGGPPPGVAVDFTPEQFADAVALLVQPHQRLVQAVLPGMRGRGFGRIVAIGSSGVQAPLDRLVASNAARAALAGYLKTLAGEVAADGVTVNMVLPGRIATDRVGVLDRANAERSGKSEEEVREAAKASIPAGRYGTPDEFAAVVTFLASTAASYVTGEQIRCDGGLVRTH